MCAHKHTAFPLSLLCFYIKQARVRAFRDGHLTHTHTLMETLLAYMKADVPRTDFFCRWNPFLNEVHQSLRVIFHSMCNVGCINDMKWYKVTYSRAARCLIIMWRWWNVELVECHLSLCDDCINSWVSAELFSLCLMVWLENCVQMDEMWQRQREGLLKSTSIF